MNTVIQTKKGISGYTLKMIALITMLIDHTAAVILARALNNVGAGSFVTMENYEFWYEIYRLMRNVGRMAFPIYCFLLVEGFRHTKDLKKYIGRLFLFALISEIPFDIAFNDQVLEFGYNNVFFTLWTGLCVISAMQFIRIKLDVEHRTGAKKTLAAVVQVLLTIGVLLLGIVVAEILLATDYGAAGIMAIFAIYTFYYNPLLGFGTAVVFLGIMAGSTEYYALLMLIPLYFYNGTRGKQVKYLFYGFYPVHLLLLSGIAAVLGLVVIRNY